MTRRTEPPGASRTVRESQKPNTPPRSDAMLAGLVRADAFGLPFPDTLFDVIGADPPYRGRNRGKKGIHYKAVGYEPYRGREW